MAVEVHNPIASISAGPSTTGFIRAGRDIGLPVDQWRAGVKFESGPCDPPISYPNKQVACEITDSLVDADLITDADPKEEHVVAFEAFYPWTIYENIVCDTSDVVKQRHLDLIETRVGQLRSSLFAQEFSGGGYSGSPSLATTAVPLSTTAYTLTQAIQRLIDARVAAGAPGPHFIHLPIVLEPLASSLTLVSTDDYRLVFDNYVKAYVPTENTADGDAPAVIPNASQAWIGITGPYEYTFDSIEVESVKTLDSKQLNKRFVQAEQKLFFRYETCNTFLAKVTVYS